MSDSRFSNVRAFALALACATALTACSTTNWKKDNTEALDVEPTPSATATTPVDKTGKPLTKAQIQAAVKAGKLPKSGLSTGPSASSTRGAATPGGARGGSTTGTPAATKKWTGAIGPGVSATTIKIGISTFKIGDFAKNLGVNVDVGDGEKQAYAVIDYVNAHGGIAGRKVVPSFFEVDFTKSGGTDGQFEAAACAQWTSDDKVFGVINLSLQRQQLLACLANKDVFGVHQGLQIDEQRMAPNRRYYYATIAGSGVIQDRAAHTEDAMLCRRGWFKGATVGIIYFDEPAMKHIVDKIYTPEIKKCGGVKVVPQAAGRGLTTPDSSFVARFQREGVTNVMFLGEGGSYPYTFMPAAENQLYRPKYSLRSDHAPAIQLAAAQVPPNQLRNAIGIGWSPVQDVPADGDQGPTNSADRLCLDIFRKANIPQTDRGARLASMSVCSGLLFIQQAMNRSTSVNSAAFAKAVGGMGTSFIPPDSYTCRFSVTQHDCISSYREFAYDFNARGFRYTSGNRPMALG